MSKLFQRACHIVVDGKAVDGLRVSFKVMKTLEKEPNTCELAIFNLSESTRSSFQKKGAKVLVEAGYVGTTALIFSGDARTIDHIRQGPDWITKVSCGDGERAYEKARVSSSHKPGTTGSDIARGILDTFKGFGVDVVDAVKKIATGKLSTEQFVNGFSAFGSSSAELDRLLKGRGLEWSIQDGRLQILPAGEATTEVAIVLDSTSGLIGSPEHGTPDKKDGRSALKVKSLLQPEIRPGRRLRVNASGTKGDFRVVTVTHEGDTMGGPWYSDAECNAL